MLVDFGRAVDLTQFSDKCDDVRNMLLHGNACKDDMRCVAMRDGKPWSFDIDTYGILCTVHVLLHGSHMEIRKGKDNNWRPISRLKRYWEQDLWTEIFNSLLNLDDVSGAAIGSRARSLRALREKIDIVLKEKESTLRPALIRQVSFLPLSREKL